MPGGLVTDGTTLWVVDNSDNKLYAYTISSGAQDTSKEFTLHSDNGNPGGATLYSNHFYITDTSDNKVYAYTTSGSRVAAKISLLALQEIQSPTTVCTSL